MDVGPFIAELKPAPCAVFEGLDARRGRPRFHVQRREGVWDAVSWGAFADDIRRIAGWLRERVGLQAEERAAVFAPNSVAWMSAALGIQAAGGAMVPIYGSSTAQQAAYVLEHSDARVVFVDSEALLERVLEVAPGIEALAHIVWLGDADRVAELDAVTPLSDVLEAGEGLDEHALGDLLSEIDLDAMGMMLYTSGTSGPPKGVPLTHRNVAANARDWLVVNAPLLHQDAVDLLWLPMSHVFGFGEACLGNTLGFTSWLCAPGEALQRMPEVRPTVFMSVPAYWEKLAVTAQAAGPEGAHDRLRELTGGRLRFCLSGGAGLKREVKSFFHEAGLLIIEGYGLTEASPTLTLNRADAFRFDAVGKALPSVALRLAEDGEIQARGPNVFGGYHKMPEATREAFTDDGWLKTGDLGRFTEDGFLQIIGRKKEILVTRGGKNVSPANIEGLFADDPFIAQVVVYGDGQKYLVAGVWLNEDEVAAELGGQVDEEAVRALVSERIERANTQLARFESIKKFAIMREPLTVEGGHLTPTLKLRRKAVYAEFGAQLAELYG